MGCRINDNAKKGEYDNTFSQLNGFPEKLCSGKCEGCPHYYQKPDYKTELKKINQQFKTLQKRLEGS